MTLSPTRTTVLTKGRAYRVVNPIAELVIEKIVALSAGSDISKNSGFTEIEKLVKSLAKLPGIERVRAVSHKPDDLHEVTFEILSYIHPPERRELAAKAMALVRETEWMLCDTTNDGDWDFGTQMLRKFPTVSNENQVIASSYARRECLSAAS
ncbi:MULTISPECIES: hypothetical protein [unclassified Coleofasciculus]|uniref:hypothetical protein n=1 Tax=unclassified Coleofasciculus TaxID=2692782 RepID=UPI00187DDE07|nr:MULTISPECIES: hypothetical protein [unclassified Coleofasciculus]MBE9129283.1 hypothetical protein [Coleofasciculus sp. LEGE 07081]MBE9151909.1 hypothetical protein [Coleofasciculus sp. LEGE 07092]